MAAKIMGLMQKRNRETFAVNLCPQMFLELLKLKWLIFVFHTILRFSGIILCDTALIHVRMILLGILHKKCAWIHKSDP